MGQGISHLASKPTAALTNHYDNTMDKESTNKPSQVQPGERQDSAALLARVLLLEFSPVQMQFHVSPGDLFQMSHPSQCYLLVGVFACQKDLEAAQFDFAVRNDLVWVEEDFKWEKKVNLVG